MANFCSRCGYPLDANASFCSNCGIPIKNDQTFNAPTPPYVNNNFDPNNGANPCPPQDPMGAPFNGANPYAPQDPMGTPFNGDNNFGVPPMQNQPQPQPQPPAKPVDNSPKAALILGILGIVFAWFFAFVGHVLSIIGIIIGAVELKKTRKPAGLIVSIVGETCAIASSIIGFLISVAAYSSIASDFYF